MRTYINIDLKQNPPRRQDTVHPRAKADRTPPQEELLIFSQLKITTLAILSRRVTIPSRREENEIRLGPSPMIGRCRRLYIHFHI